MPPSSASSACLAEQWHELCYFGLHAAGALEKMRELLAQGADPNEFGCRPYTPLGRVLAPSDAATAPRPSEVAGMVEVLLAHGADLNRVCRPGATPLAAAAALMDSAPLDVLLARGANISPPPGTLPLLHAALRGGTPHVARLLEAGASLSAKDEQGELPLAVAIGGGRWADAALLVNSGAELGPSGPLHRSALCLACQQSIEGGAPDLLFRLLDLGVNPNASDCLGRPPLFYLAAQCQVDEPNKLALVKKLLRHGADPRQRDHAGLTVLEVIKEHRAPLLKDCLQRACVDLDAAEIARATATVEMGRQGRRL